MLRASHPVHALRRPAIALAVGILLAGCGSSGGSGGGGSSEDQLREAVEAQIEAGSAGDAEGFHDSYSSACKKKTTVKDVEGFLKTMEVIGDWSAEITKVEIEGDKADVTTQVVDGDGKPVSLVEGGDPVPPETDPWVREDGDWRAADC